MKRIEVIETGKYYQLRVYLSIVVCVILAAVNLGLVNRSSNYSSGKACSEDTVTWI